MKETVKKQLALVLALLVILAVSLLFAGRKNGMFIDEIYTYGLANSHFAAYLEDAAGGSLEDVVLTRQDLLDYVVVNDGEALDFASVYDNQIHDVHPPLYYWFFNAVSSLTPNVYSKWTGLSLDLCFFLLTLIALYRLVLALFGSRENAVAAVILYGLSALGLSTMLLIRMYALMSLFTVLLALWITRLMQRERRVYYPLIALTVFLGLLTQYYFVFYAFFVCAAYVFWAAAKRRWKSLGLFAVSAFAGVGLMLLVFPACIQHLTADKLVSGGNALEQLSVVSQYKARLLLFIKELRHGMKAAVVVALAAVAGLLLCFKKLRAAGKARQLPWESLVILLPAPVAFVVVALISPVTEQRYIYNLVPLFAACVSFLLALLERSLGDFPRKALWKNAALLGILALSLLFARAEPPKYLYPVDPCYVDTYAEYDALVARHDKAPCVYLTGTYITPTQDLGQLLAFADVFVTEDPDSPALDRYLAERPSDECVVYVDTNAYWSSGFAPAVMLPALVASTDYTDWEPLYATGLSAAYLLKK